MKGLTKIGAILLIGASVFVTACAPPPPPVTKDELKAITDEADAAVKIADQRESERNRLTEDLDSKKAELKKLKKFHREIKEKE
ncbi:MAG: hypothetical protein CSB55_03440 [Candidatus Cloacimonadota bacterium]|nr:MAG: hypothetical protein CSB55_03440 [Candidatus Cloacimonadota bacterium]